MESKLKIKRIASKYPSVDPQMYEELHQLFHELPDGAQLAWVMRNMKLETERLQNEPLIQVTNGSERSLIDFEPVVDYTQLYV